MFGLLKKILKPNINDYCATAVFGVEEPENPMNTFQLYYYYYCYYCNSNDVFREYNITNNKDTTPLMRE